MLKEDDISIVNSAESTDETEEEINRKKEEKKLSKYYKDSGIKIKNIETIFELYLQGIGFSIISNYDFDSKEIMYIYMKDLHVSQILANKI